MTSPYPLSWNQPIYPGGTTNFTTPYDLFGAMPIRGDLLVMNMVCYPGVGVPPGEGWVLNLDGDTTVPAGMAWKWATGSEAPNTGNWTGSAYWHMWMFLIRGLAYPGELPTHDPFDGVAQRSISMTNQNVPVSLTTSQADELLMFCDMNFPGGAMTSPPAGMTPWYDPANYVHAAYEYKRAAGASGTKQATYSAAGQNQSLLYAIKGHVPEIVVGGVKTPAKSISGIQGGAKSTAVNQFSIHNQGVRYPH